MNIINRRSATTLLVCCLFGAGFLMDGGQMNSDRSDQPAPPPPQPLMAEAAPIPVLVESEPLPVAIPVAADRRGDHQLQPAGAPERPPQAEPPEPTVPIGTGVRLPSAPLMQDQEAAAARALAEDLDALLQS